MMKPTSLGVFAIAAIAALPLSFARAETSPVTPMVRPAHPMAPAFDLAIVGGDTKLSPVAPVGANGVTATYAVTLKNLGAEAITQENVGCKLGAIELIRAANNLTIARGEQGTVLVTTTTPWASIPTGSQSIQCAATIAAPALARDANTANNTWSGTVTARLLPDLQVTSATLRDCHTAGAATIGDTVCIGLEYANLGGPLSQNAFIQCSVTRLSPVATWTLNLVNIGIPAPNSTGTATPIFADGNVVGQYRTTCTADPAKGIAESNESNNALVVTSGIILPEYDIATVAAVAGTGTCSAVSGQYQFATPYTVTVRNDGTKDVTGVSVSCKFPNHGVGSPAGTTTTTLAPKAKQDIAVCFAPPLNPSEQLYCKATITGPPAVSDQHPANDGWLGKTSPTTPK
jgi:hypothetical protein